MVLTSLTCENFLFFDSTWSPRAPCSSYCLTGRTTARPNWWRSRQPGQRAFQTVSSLNRPCAIRESSSTSGSSLPSRVHPLEQSATHLSPPSSSLLLSATLVYYYYLIIVLLHISTHTHSLSLSLTYTHMYIRAKLGGVRGGGERPKPMPSSLLHLPCVVLGDRGPAAVAHVEGRRGQGRRGTYSV